MARHKSSPFWSVLLSSKFFSHVAGRFAGWGFLAHPPSHLSDAAGMRALHGLNWKHLETHDSSGNQEVRQLPLGQGLGGQRIELHPHYPLVSMKRFLEWIKRFMRWNEKLKPSYMGSTKIPGNLAMSLEIVHTNKGKTECWACWGPGS